jgi:hypothetical protein
VGMAGGRSSRTNTVMRTAKIASENAFSRSGVALAWNTIVLLGASAIHLRFRAAVAQESIARRRHLPPPIKWQEVPHVRNHLNASAQVVELHIAGAGLEPATPAL